MLAATRMLEHTMQQAPDFSTYDFCGALIASLVVLGRDRMPIDDPASDEGLRAVVGYLHSEARRCARDGKRESAMRINDIVGDLCPNPNTGAFDLFWHHIRRQQPGRIGVPNPDYEHVRINLGKRQAMVDLEDLKHSDPFWYDLVTKAADRLNAWL